MDAIAQIPQAFFEFFARLIPGAVAFALWMTLFDGAGHWPNVLDAIFAKSLPLGDVVSAALTVALIICYVAGQLIAPFGKQAQQITEEIVRARNLKIFHQAAFFMIYRAEAPANKTKAKDGDYDWLRANAPEIGALVAKIRAEYTMFYALAAVFFGAFIALLIWPTPAPVFIFEIGALAVFIIACAGRGFSTKKTCRETATKLRAAREPYLKAAATSAETTQP